MTMTPGLDPNSSASATPPSSDAPKPAGSILERIDPLGSFWRHKFIALFLMAVIAAAGLPFAWIKGKPLYYTEAVIFISPRFLKNLQDDKELEMQSNSQYREYVQQHVRTINRYDIVEEAFNASTSFAKTWLLPGEPPRRSIERLMGALAIRPVPDTYQITVGVAHDFQAGLAEFINKMVEVYLRKAKSEEFYASDVRVASLRREAAELSSGVAANQAKRTALAQDLGVTTFSDSFVNPYDRLLIAAKEAVADARRKRIEAAAALQMLDGAASGQKRKVVDALAAELAGKDTAVTSALGSINTRRADLAAKISGLGDKHPGRIAAMQELAELDAERQRTLDRHAAVFANMLTDQRKGELRRAEQIERELAAEAERQQSQASYFTENYQAGIGMGLEIAQSRKRLDSIDDRIRYFAQEGSAPGFARVFSPARPPDLPIKGGRTKIFAMFCAVALLLGLIVPIALDVLDPRVFSIGDAGRVLGFPPLGWVPDQASGGAPFYREQLLRIAHRMDQERTSHGTRIWCFTGAKSGAGTTTLVAAIGKALHDLGISALTVEANAWRSDPSYRSQGRGLSVVLRGNSELAANIEPACDDAAAHLPVGDIDDTGHLPDVHRLIDVLQGAASAYDIVLVDLPPIIASVDAEYIARRADIVVLVAGAITTQSGDLRAASKVLEKNQPRAVASILNRVRVKGGPAFAQAAFDEFTKGNTAPAPGWRSPWLWK